MSSFTLRQYAAHRRAAGLPGGSLSAVQKALRAGRIVANRGRINPEAADHQWAQNTNPAYQRLTAELVPPAGADDRSGFAVARGALLEALADREAGGSSAEAVRAAAAGLARAVLDELRPARPAREAA
jgi:hypothetical protein